MVENVAGFVLTGLFIWSRGFVAEIYFISVESMQDFIHNNTRIYIADTLP